MSNRDRPALERWQQALASWALPEEILAQASDEPYRLDPALFRPKSGACGEGPPTGSPTTTVEPPHIVSAATQRAVEALPRGGAVLDVGCGGGAAAFAMGEAVGNLVGVDESAAMLEVFTAEADARELPCRTVEGRWPDAAPLVGDGPAADVVVCHHVAYNVPDLAAFVIALDAAARRRVVMELTLTHPQTPNNDLWRHFWGLERPEGPTAEDAFAVVVEAGLDARLEFGSTSGLRREPPWASRVASATRLLCLAPERASEVEERLELLPPRSTDRAVIWWDVDPVAG